jgi:pyrophosphatase PpaX
VSMAGARPHGTMKPADKEPGGSATPLPNRVDADLAARTAALEAVLFDLDGTLIDSIELILASFRYATERVLGARLPDEELMRNVGVPLARQMREFSPEHAEELLGVYREHNARVHDEMLRSYAGIEDMLVAMTAAGMRLGVVTSKMRHMALRGLERYDLVRFFDLVVGSDDVAKHKPDPHPLFVAAGELGVSIARCAYVGDSPHDMAAARAAGCVSIAALWGAFEAEVVLEPGADYAVASPGELLAIAGAPWHR